MHPLIRRFGGSAASADQCSQEIDACRGVRQGLKKPTRADMNIIRHDPFLVAGGPEPRNHRLGFHPSARESSRVMIRVGGPYPESPEVQARCPEITPISRRGGSSLG
jgi:hypothetical protein